MIRKLAFLVLKEVRTLCSLMDLSEKVNETVAWYLTILRCTSWCYHSDPYTLESAIHQINHYPAANGDITRDDSQGRFLAKHSVATLLRYCFEWLQRYSNITTLCFAKNPYTFPIKVVARRCWSINSLYLVWSSPFFSSPICVIKHWYHKENFDTDHS